MDVRYAGQLEKAWTRIRFGDFLQILKAGERRNRQTRLRAVAQSAAFCENRLDLRISIRSCPSMNPLQNQVAVLSGELVGHGPHQRCLEPGAFERAVILCANALHHSLSHLLMRLDVDEKQIRQRNQITDNDNE